MVEAWVGCVKQTEGVDVSVDGQEWGEVVARYMRCCSGLRLVFSYATVGVATGWEDVGVVMWRALVS